MIPNELLDRIKVQAGQGLNIPVVDALSTESLPTPCISVGFVSMDRFSVTALDVFNATIQIKYEEHYADTTTASAKYNFDVIVNNFNRVELKDDLQGTGYHLFDLRIENGASSVEGDILCYQIDLLAIVEIKK